MTTHRADYNPAPRIGRDTREEIKSLGISLDDYVANIESKLRARGESSLANRMLDEIRESTRGLS